MDEPTITPMTEEQAAQLKLASQPRDVAIPPPKILGHLTKEQKITVENIALRFENISLKKDQIQQALVALQEEERRAKQEATAIKTEIATKFNTTAEKIRIRTDGSIEEAP